MEDLANRAVDPRVLRGLARQGAHNLMQGLCRILPVARVDGQWVVCEGEH